MLKKIIWNCPYCGETHELEDYVLPLLLPKRILTCPIKRISAKAKELADDGALILFCTPREKYVRVVFERQFEYVQIKEKIDEWLEK